MTGVLAAVLVSVAAGVAAAPLARPRSAARLARLAPLPVQAPGGITGTAPPVRRSRWRERLDPVRCGAGVGGVAVALLVGGWFGLLAGAVAAVALDRGLRRLEPAAVRAARLAEAAELPLAVDLLAVALRGGAPVSRAVAAVAEALSGPLRDRLARVARVMSLGGTPAEAWTQLGSLAGADRLVRAAVRSAEHGSSLAGALARLADDLRADRAIAVEAAARRAGVLIVLPLGLCFLPAFILAGLVPVIVAILGDFV